MVVSHWWIAVMEHAKKNCLVNNSIHALKAEVMKLIGTHWCQSALTWRQDLASVVALWSSCIHNILKLKTRYRCCKWLSMEISIKLKVTGGGQSIRRTWWQAACVFFKTSALCVFGQPSDRSVYSTSFLRPWMEPLSTLIDGLHFNKNGLPAEWGERRRTTLHGTHTTQRPSTSPFREAKFPS